jgi:hypothetical protein
MRLHVLGLCFLAVPALAFGQPPGTPAGTAAAATPMPHVKAATNVAGKQASEIGDRIDLKVENLNSWRQQPGNGSTPLHLFLAGIELKNVVAVPTAPDAGDAANVSALFVNLDVDDKDTATRKAWVQVLQTAIPLKAQQPIRISVGPPGAEPFASDATLLLLVFPSYTWYIVALMAVVAVVLFVLDKKSNILRDPTGAATPPYSLGRHQMATWFVVVLWAYLYIWLITGSATLSSTALILIGVSGATGLAAAIIDANKRNDAATARAALDAERDALDRVLNDPATGLQAQLRVVPAGSADAAQLTTTIAPKLARLQDLKTLLSVPAAVPVGSRRWYLDLLSDENGASFHRFQMAVWTIVLAMVFVRTVYTDLVMPAFDVTLLGLMGISSGTYLGFKFPEVKS